MKRIADLQEGDSLPAIQMDPVTRLDLIKYAGASGDFNPIHTIDAEAEEAGLPGIIAHGMWTMGNLAKIFTPYLEEGFVQDYAVRFKGMVFLGDIITLEATVVEKRDAQVIFQVQAINQSDKDVLKGELSFSL